MKEHPATGGRLTREEVEIWRRFLKAGDAMMSGQIDALCDMALSALSETPPLTARDFRLLEESQKYGAYASACRKTPVSAIAPIVTDEMVDRFLSWKLPEDFHPDAGISFSPEFNVEYHAKHGRPPQRHEPIGTNLLTATQARAMLEHVLSAPPVSRQNLVPVVRTCDDCGADIFVGMEPK